MKTNVLEQWDQVTSERARGDREAELVDAGDALADELRSEQNRADELAKALEWWRAAFDGAMYPGADAYARKLLAIHASHRRGWA